MFGTFASAYLIRVVRHLLPDAAEQIASELSSVMNDLPVLTEMMISWSEKDSSK